MARIGYARVRTTDQELDIQIKRLKAEECSIIRSEKVSGASRDGRSELATIIDFLRPGDELTVTRLDRLGRSTRDVLNIIHECEQRQAFVTVLDPHVTTRGEMWGTWYSPFWAWLLRWSGASSKNVSEKVSLVQRKQVLTRAGSGELNGILCCNSQPAAQNLCHCSCSRLLPYASLADPSEQRPITRDPTTGIKL